MKWIWDAIGLGMIITGLIAFFFQNSPVMAALLIFSPPVASQLSWIAANLELIIPMGVFLLLVQPNAKSVALSGGIALVLGIFMWVVLAL